MKKVGMNPEVIEINEELEVYQELVGGWIEVFPFLYDTLCVCNEEGKILGLPQNFIFYNDSICGDVFFVSQDGDDFGELTDEQIEILMTIFNLTKN